VVRRRGSAAGHGWRWPAVRPVPAAGEMRKTTAVAAVIGEREEDGCGGGRWWRRRLEEEDRVLGRVCGVSPTPPRVEYRRTPFEHHRLFSF
jgi:hypothetical protein